jgi:hypothetical protein
MSSIVYRDIWGHNIYFDGFSVVPCVLNKFHPDKCIFDVRGHVLYKSDVVDGVDTRLIESFSCEEYAVAFVDRLNSLLNKSESEGC